MITPLKIRGVRGVMKIMEITPFNPPYFKGEIQEENPYLKGEVQGKRQVWHLSIRISIVIWILTFGLL